MADTSNSADIIDSRDIIARIEELESIADDDGNVLYEDGPDIDGDLTEELASLRKLAAEAQSATNEWQHGAALIADSYFPTYAEELAEDCGMTSREARWPYTCIDWEQAAEELQQDYTSIEYDGVTYWTR